MPLLPAPTPIDANLHIGNAGGYHHHLGLNTWNSAGAAPPPPDMAALRAYELIVPDAAARAHLRTRLEAAGVPIAPHPAGMQVQDPAHNTIIIRG